MTSMRFVPRAALVATVTLAIVAVGAAEQAGAARAAPRPRRRSRSRRPRPRPRRPSIRRTSMSRRAGVTPSSAWSGAVKVRTAPAVRPPGLSGLLIGEITVKGVVRDRQGFIAMVQAPDNKTYAVRVGDKLLDGSVKSITQEKVIFSQDVNDPLSLVKQREVPKPVRQTEGRG